MQLDTGLHDIGKTSFPDNYEFSHLIPLSSTVVDIPYCNHGQCESSGYPGKQITLAVRIFYRFFRTA